MNLQVQRYSLNKVLLKGTVEHITPVVEDERKMEEDDSLIKEQETEEEDVGETERKQNRMKKRVKHFQVHLQEGVVLKAHNVIVATGPTRAQMANIPSWVTNIGENFPEERIQHTVHLMHHLAKRGHECKDADDHRQTETPSNPGESDFF